MVTKSIENATFEELSDALKNKKSVRVSNDGKKWKNAKLTRFFVMGPMPCHAIAKGDKSARAWQYVQTT